MEGKKPEADISKYLKASLLIQLKTLSPEEKPEFLLFSAGFSIQEIAALLDKKYDTVQKAIKRG